MRRRCRSRRPRRRPDGITYGVIVPRQQTRTTDNYAKGTITKSDKAIIIRASTHIITLAISVLNPNVALSMPKINAGINLIMSCLKEVYSSKKESKNAGLGSTILEALKRAILFEMEKGLLNDMGKIMDDAEIIILELKNALEKIDPSIFKQYPSLRTVKRILEEMPNENLGSGELLDILGRISKPITGFVLSKFGTKTIRTLLNDALPRKSLRY